MGRRGLKGTRGPDYCNRAVDACGTHEIEVATDRQKRNCEAFHPLADTDDCLSVEAIRSMPNQQHQQKHRQKLHQTNHAQGEGAVRHAIELPADGHPRHLV